MSSFRVTVSGSSLTDWRSYWARFRLQATPQAQRRFVKSVELFVRAIEQQAKDREAGVIPDMETYVVLRRNTGGCRPCWVMLEYANNVSIRSTSSITAGAQSDGPRRSICLTR